MSKKNKRIRGQIPIWLFIVVIPLIIIIPIIYPFVGGLIFDQWLFMPEMVPFIFWSLIALYIISAISLIFWIVLFIVQRVKIAKRKGSR